MRAIQESEYLGSYLDPWHDMGFGSKYNVTLMIVGAILGSRSIGISKAGLELLFDLLGLTINETRAIFDRDRKALQDPCEDVRRSAAIGLINKVDVTLKSVGMDSFLRLPVTETSTETYNMVMVAKFMFLSRNKRKKISELFRIFAMKFGTRLSTIEKKSCPAGLPIRNPPTGGRGDPTRNPGAGDSPGTGSGAGGAASGAFGGGGGASRGQGDGGDDNGDHRNGGRGPRGPVVGRDWFQLLFVILGSIVNLLNLFAALRSLDDNSITSIFTADNAIVLVVVGVSTLVMMLLLHVLNIIDLANPPNN